MADIFVSYVHEDRGAVSKLVHALKGEGWSVWWDPEVLPGEHYDRVIERELDAAWCIVVVWSALSLKSNNVRNEAVVGRQRGCLIQVTMDGASWPSTFAGWQAVNLTGWNGDADDRRFEALRAGIGRMLEEEQVRIRRALKGIEEIKAAREIEAQEAERRRAEEDAIRDEAEEENCWYDAVKHDDYESYLEEYPNGRYTAEARQRLEEEDEAWQEAEDTSDYESYLEDYPNGRYAGVAKERIDRTDSTHLSEEDERLYQRWRDESDPRSS